MGKVKDMVIDEDASSKMKPEPVLTHTAISMGLVPGEGWSLIKIKYNPATGDVGPIQKKYTGELRAYIEEKFKIETITDNLFNNGEERY